MSRLLLAVVAVAFMAGLPSPARAHCAIERARYAMRHDAKVTAGFTRIAGEPRTLSKLAFHIDFAKQKDRFWWFFDGGSARQVSMLATTDPTRPGWDPENDQRHIRSMSIWLAGADYDFTYYYPKAGQRAPEHIFIPELEEVMWYSVPDAQRRGVPVGLFDLAGCG